MWTDLSLTRRWPGVRRGDRPTLGAVGCLITDLAQADCAIGHDGPVMTLRIPQYHELMWPALQATMALGGSATVREMNERVMELGKISEEQQAVPHGNNGRMSEVEDLGSIGRARISRASVCHRATVVAGPARREPHLRSTVHEVSSPTVTKVIASDFPASRARIGRQPPAKDRRRDVGVQDDVAHAKPDLRAAYRSARNRS